MNNYRQIVSIALLITSVVLILTGGLILLHLDSRTVMHLHKYFGVAFMVAALLHMGINSKPLRHYLACARWWSPCWWRPSCWSRPSRPTT